jgi:hypothetical protein
LWFRCRSLRWRRRDAHHHRPEEGEGDPLHVYPRLSGIIPLLTFGKMFEGYQIDNESTSTSWTYKGVGFSSCAWHTLATETRSSTNTSPVETSSYLADPSLLGVRVSNDGMGGVAASLAVRIQTSSFGSGSWVNPVWTTHYGDQTQALIVNWTSTDPCRNRRRTRHGRTRCTSA